MKGEEILKFYEKRIFELTNALGKAKYDVKPLIEHSLQINEILYIQELKKQGIVRTAPVTSSSLQ